MAGNTHAHRAVKSRGFRRITGSASMLVLAAMGSGHALAQCAPSPSQSNQTTTCSGTQSGGYVISTDQSPLVVNAGASIVNSGDAVAVSIPANSYYDYRTTTITVNGSISSSGGNGIAIDSGMPYQIYYGYPGTSGTITVGAGGSISGTTGIMLSLYPGNTGGYAPVNISLDNSGSITGTSGIALATTGSFTNFSAITNESTGTIGAIAGSFSTIANHGTIDGGSLTAVANTSPYNGAALSNDGTIKTEGAATTVLLNTSYNFTNSGTITNTGGGIAISNPGSLTNQAGGTISANGSDVVTGTYLSVTNSGTIANTGAGQAISGSSINVTNLSGGTIGAGSGGIAINASSSLNLVNGGTINGDVLAGSASASYQGVSVDSSQGTINGNVTFGGGENTLVATLSNGVVQTGITGTITGGTGAAATNTLQVASTADTTLSSNIALPLNFTQLSFAPAGGTTLTLAAGFSNPGTIIDQGPGTLTNATTLSGTGQIVSGGFFSGNFINTGSITASNAGGLAAVALMGYASLTNSGAITATGDAVSGSGNNISNSGTITAGGTAVQAFVEAFSNSGTITSTGGTALILSTGCTCTNVTNSGTINGATIGVQLEDGVLNNTGTITSPGYGIAPTYYGTINNQAGGVITGGTYAIGSPNGAPGLDYVNNAGTINGNVNLVNAGFSTNTYDAAPGGVLNGNLTIGAGDTLITDFVNTGSGAFAGITGTVAASQSNLIYNVGSSATASGTAPAGFSSIAYQLSNAPTLTFDTTAAYTATLGLAGTGSVVFGGSIATTNAVAVQSQSYIAPPNSGYTSTALTITNNGTIAATKTIAYNPPYSAVALLSSDTLVNNGTISFTDLTGVSSYQTETAVSGGQSITNNGTISASGAAAVGVGGYYNAPQTLINAGTLTSDTITVVVSGTANISNTGTITTSGQAAIGEPGYYAYGTAVVNNLAGGTISGSGDAIELPGGTVSNAGTIDGNVNLAYSPFGYPVFNSGAYNDNGGTLNGNLTLAPYEALVINGVGSGHGPLGGVTGTINANGAALVYNVAGNATTSAGSSGGASGFGTIGYLISNNAALTFDATTNLTATLGIAGGGSVIFNGTITTTDTPALISQDSALLNTTGTTASSGGLNITNNGTIATIADANSQPVAVLLGQSDTLTNNGTIGLASTNPVPGNAAVSGGASVTNAGTIFASNANGVNVGSSYYSPIETVTNSGTITSNLLAIAENGPATVTNSGYITSTGGAAIGLTNYYGYYSSYPVSIINQASGVISGVGDAIVVQGGTIGNAGTINGNVNLAYSIYGYPYGGSGVYADNGGTLNGNLTLGPYQALVINGATPGSGPLGGVNGTINANGAALIFDVASDATTAAGSNGTSGFGTVVYVLGNNAALTITSDSNLTSTLSVAGSGSVILNGTIATSDAPGLASQVTALLAPSGLSSATTALTITNNGTIATSADASFNFPFAVSLGGNDTLINNGSIGLTNNNPQNFYATAVSGGLNVINAGTISATNASAIYVGNGNASGETLTNSGTITSDLLAITENSTATIVNSGTIASTGGAAIGQGPYFGFFGGYSETITNLAGGVITGLGDAIDMQGGIVSNAGIINGNVNLASGYSLYAPGAYYANGGTLNGNLTLEQNQALVVDYTATGNPLGGITGTINASGAALFYNLTSAATLTSAPTAAGFASVGYQLSNNATLTLASGTLLTQTLGLSGQGTVVLGGSIITSDQAAVLSQAPFAINASAPTTTALTITNNGGIIAATDDADVYVNAAVSLGSGDTLVNNGTITRTNLGLADSYETAVLGGLSVTNTGTILGVGVSAVGTTTNNNTNTATAIINSGTITSDQFAIMIGGVPTIANSGAITSTGMAAIGDYYFYNYASGAVAQIDNLAGGVISGVGDAIDLNGGRLANAGTINGNVNLNYSPYYGNFYFVSGAFFNNGGTLNGNLTLGSGQSLYTGLGSVDGGNIANVGSVQGITGTVNPNYAYLIYLVSADGSDAVTTPAGFGGIGYQLSNDATLTLSPAATLTTSLGLSGTGSVIFNGSITTAALPAIISSPVGTIDGAATTPNDLTITNNGTLSTALQNNYYFNSTLQPSTVFLTSGDTLINTGSIVLTNATGALFPTAAAVYGGAVLSNSGTISGTGVNAISLGVPATSGGAVLLLTNSGSITSDQLAVQINGAAAITNSGTISGGIAIAGTGAGTLITNQAAGIITGTSDAIDLLGGTVANSGTINGNVDLAFGATATSGSLSGGYFASGGTLNGNLVLGPGETLVTDIANPGAGITGTVTASGAALIYDVSATTTSTAALPTGFTSLAYQLFGSPTLTLASGSNLTTTLGLAGSGAVIFDGTITTTDAAALKSQPVLTSVGYATSANALAITNSGTISATFDSAATAVPGAVVLGSGDTFTNTGSITATNSGTISPSLAIVSGGQSLTNSGTIAGSGLSGVALGSSGVAPALVSLTNSGAIGSDQYGVLVQGLGRTLVVNTGTITGNLAALVVTGATEIDNYSVIIGGAGPAVLGQGSGATKIINGGIISATGDAIDLAGGFVDNSKRIIGNVNLGDITGNTTPGTYIADGVGTLAGNLSFSSANGGNELIETGAGFGVTGTISGGAGTNYVGHSIGFNGVVTLGNLPTGFSVELTYATAASHLVTLTGPANYAANIYVGGDGGIVNQASTNGIVTGLAASGEVYLAGMGGQLASFTNEAQVGGIALATNTLVNSGTVGSATTAGPVLTQTVNGALLFANSGTIVAQPGSGTAAQLAVLITGAPTGASLIGNNGTITGGLAVAYSPTAGAALTVNNAGTITGAPLGTAQDVALAVLPVVNPDTAGDTVSVINSGAIIGDIQLAASSDTLVDAAGGSIRGNIILQPGAGSGSITLAGNFAGSIDGGQGPTSLAVSGGSAAQPVAFGGITSVSGYSQTGGYATLAGSANVGTAAITGGTFVGLIGSIFNASQITVGSGATFASGGTINGNLAIAGTLHVGASPGTMAVNGNVALASGSTSVFEVSPTASSKLVVSGQVGIGTGTTLQIVQLQPLAPGAAIDLISAGGGITGNFTNVTGIDGALVEQGDSLSLRALFDTSQTANPQVTRGANYLNALIVNGTASPALLAALPVLQAAGGPPIAAAFARLTPEPYASAEQIGVENALMVSRSLRDLNFDSGMHSGQFFTFGEALGNRRGLEGNAAIGTSNSTLTGYGFIGGLGIGGPAASLAAFGGYIDQTQRIDALTASTHAKGFVGGVTGRLASGPAQLNVSVIHDDAHASTDRQSPDNVALTGDYKLHSWTLDGELATSFRLPEGWAARPHIGATWVWTRRGAAVEDNLSPFALTVAGDHHNSGFIDGGVRFDMASEWIGAISPYVDLGMRYKLNGRAVEAVAGIDGGPVTLFSPGDHRRRMSAQVETGIRYRVNPAVSLFLTGNGDFSRDESSGTATGGVTVRF